MIRQGSSIGLDMDNVITDTAGALLRVLNARHGSDVDLDALMDMVRKGKPGSITAEMYYQVLREPGFFRHLPFLDADCRSVIERLQTRYDIYIVTAAMEVQTSLNDKFDWLREQLPSIDPQHFIFCGKKDVIHTDFLIDDNIHRYTGYRGQGLLYHTPMNQDIACQHPRVKNWQEIAAYFGV